jgi:hypothetical protein
MEQSLVRSIFMVIARNMYGFGSIPRFLFIKLEQSAKKDSLSTAWKFFIIKDFFFLIGF